MADCVDASRLLYRILFLFTNGDFITDRYLQAYHMLQQGICSFSCVVKAIRIQTQEIFLCVPKPKVSHS